VTFFEWTSARDDESDQALQPVESAVARRSNVANPNEEIAGTRAANPCSERELKRRAFVMVGVITTRDVLKNVGLIAREFGWACLLRCMVVLLSGRPTTFLEVALKPAR
jgi:hypothetical protein